MPLLALVHFNDLLRVDGQVLVGVYHHAEETRVRLWDKNEQPNKLIQFKLSIRCTGFKKILHKPEKSGNKEILYWV